MRSIRRGILIAAVAVPALHAQTERRALSGDRISIYNLAGKLRVQGGSGSQVTVDVARGGRDAGQLKIVTGDIRGFNTLRVIYPSDRISYRDLSWRGRTQLRVNSDGTFGSSDSDWGSRDRVEISSSGDGLDAYADLTVSVPKGQRLVVHWGVGDAVVSNVDGDLQVSVAAARVTSEHTRGHLSLDTGSGSVEVTDAQGEVVLDTGSGGVTVNGVRGESLLMDTGSGSIRGGDVDVRTLKMDVGSGGMRLDRVKAPRVTVDAGSGGIELGFLATVEDLHAEAGSGGVTIRLPATQSGELDLETGSGAIDTDFPVTMNRLSRNHLRGRIGNGNARIRVESGSGSVRLIKVSAP